MIRNIEHKELFIDYSQFENFVKYKPSDIDMFYLTDSNFLIIVEYKNEKGTFTRFQKSLFQRIIDNYKCGGAILYAAHRKSVENGDLSVEGAYCTVREMYWNGRWCVPKGLTTVGYALKTIEEKEIEILQHKD